MGQPHVYGHLMYDYRITNLLRVVDGDTVDLSLDLGFGMERTKGRYRLVIVDTPERGQDGYLEAMNALAGWLGGHFTADGLRGVTYKSDSFGRYLIDIYAKDGSTASEYLLEQGYGRYVP